MIAPTTAKIAGKAIDLQLPVLPFAAHWAPFFINSGDQPAIQTFEADALPFTMPFYGVSFIRGDIRDRIAFSSVDPSAFIRFNEDWSHVVVGGPPGEELFELMITAFYSRLSRLEPAMLLHASAIKHEGEAIVFIGPSGIGKTTQAELWRHHLQAEILNGDKVFVTMDQGCPFAHGSPWAGSSPYIVNDRAPLKAVVLLCQGTEDHIQKLSGLQALLALSKHTFFPQWDELCTANVTTMLNVALKRLPVFVLTCRPVREAVLVARQAIWAN